MDWLLCSSHDPIGPQPLPSNTRGCQSGTVRGLLDRKISEGYLQSSNESMKNKNKTKNNNKNDKRKEQLGTGVLCYLDVSYLARSRGDEA